MTRLWKLLSAAAVVVTGCSESSGNTSLRDGSTDSPEINVADGGGDGASATVASCLATARDAACLAGCREQEAWELNDAGTCSVSGRLYCGVALGIATAEVQCRVRISDGNILALPQLMTEEPPGLLRECTDAERDGPTFKKAASLCPL